jgi:hypothetical protein
MWSFSNRRTFYYLLFILFFLFPIVAAIIFPQLASEITIALWVSIIFIFAYLFVQVDSDKYLKQKLTNTTYDPDGDSALPSSLEEGRETLDNQISNLNDIDSKAARILRVNVLLTGLLLSALTVSSRNETAQLIDFQNVFFGLGIVLLILSTATAGITYTASSYRAGVSKKDITQIIEADLTEEEFNQVLAKSYATWISKNQTKEKINNFYSTTTILLLIYSVAYLSLGVFRALIQPVSLVLVGVANVSLFGLTLVSGYPSIVKEVIDEIGIEL